MASDPSDVRLKPVDSDVSAKSPRRWLWRLMLLGVGLAVAIWFLISSKFDYSALLTQVFGEQSWLETPPKNSPDEYVEPEEKAVTLGFAKQINANVILVSKKFGTVTKYDLFVLHPRQRRVMLEFTDAIIDDGITRHEDGFVSSCEFMTDYEPLEMALIVPNFKSKLINLISPRLPQLEEFKKQRGLVSDEKN
ncbi:MAG: hypothetical protein ABL888_13380 [Pirellulaceae bacterium]